MPSRSAEKLTSLDEYLVFEEGQATRHEFVAGQIYAMAVGTAAHAELIAAILQAVRPAAKRIGCTAVSEFKAKMLSETVYYPDVVITCERLENNALLSRAPCILFEVLSSSTEIVDTREKRSEYLRLPSLNLYAIVSQSERKVDAYRRLGSQFVLEVYRDAETLDLPGFGELSLNAIYDGIVS